MFRFLNNILKYTFTRWVIFLQKFIQKKKFLVHFLWQHFIIQSSYTFRWFGLKSISDEIWTNRFISKVFTRPFGVFDIFLGNFGDKDYVFLAKVHLVKPYVNYPETVFNQISALRKSKTFIKSRFSRNRQWCRPIVIFSLWVNIFFVYIVFINFYNFLFNVNFLNYLWFFIFSFFSFFFFYLFFCKVNK